MGRNLSGHSNKVTKRRAFTAWRRQREGHVRASKGVTENGALTNWRQRMELSGHRQEANFQVALTFLSAPTEGLVREK